MFGVKEKRKSFGAFSFFAAPFVTKQTESNIFKKNKT